MKNRNILLPALFSITLVCSLILSASAAGASVTIPLLDAGSISHLATDSSSPFSPTTLNTPEGHTKLMVAVSTETEHTVWNMGQTTVQYTLTVSSTAGGSVTSPGEGTFTYSEGTVVNLAVKAEAGYRFVNWSGNIATISCQCHSTTITMNGNYSIRANFQMKPPSTSSNTCFIATAAYGTPMAEEIQILREFRDRYLLPNQVGQDLVDLYYKVSPPIAAFITEHPSLKPIVRVGLLPAVAMSTTVINTNTADKMTIIGLLALALIAVAIWATKRRGSESDYT